MVCLCAAMPMHGSALHNILCLLSCVLIMFDNWLLVAEKQSDRLDHPYGWTVVDTTSLYSKETTPNSLSGPQSCRIRIPLPYRRRVDSA